MALRGDMRPDVSFESAKWNPVAVGDMSEAGTETSCVRVDAND